MPLTDLKYEHVDLGADRYALMARRIRLCVLMGASVGSVSAWAGTIRDDVPDAEYIALANEVAYEATGFHSATGVECSATLISPEWVLAAAHCVEGKTNHTFSLGSTSTSGQVYHAAEAFTHEDWDGNAGNGFDIALIRLDTPVFDVTPAQIYRGGLERRQVMTHVGYGQTGTGLTGQQTGTGGTKRAGQNTMNRFGNEVSSSWSREILVEDFDNPNDASDSLFGSANPLPLEYMIASGDSGGAAYITAGGVTYLAGIHSFISTSNEDGIADADYGDIMGSTRVSAYADWIDTNTGGAVTRFSNGQSFAWSGGGWSVSGPMDSNDTAVVNGGVVTVAATDQVAQYTMLDSGQVVVTTGSLSTQALVLKRGASVQAGTLVLDDGVGSSVSGQSGLLRVGEAGAASLLQIQVAASQSNTLTIEGQADLGGTLSLDVLADDVPDLYEAMTLITAGSVQGVFDRIEGMTDTGDDASLFAVTYDAGAVTVQRALPGDANLDGKVDQDDLQALASAFDADGARSWSEGDFNGDAVVGLDDLTILGGFYGAGALASELVSFDEAWSSFSVAVVPEPLGGGAVIGLGLGLMARRRRA